MHQNSVTLDSAGAITRYFAKANLILPSNSGHAAK